MKTAVFCITKAACTFLTQKQRLGQKVQAETLYIARSSNGRERIQA
ncbi:hypothetical protein QG053_04405 [Kingella kingae]|nr:hypothetical protein [Kingella kingae]